MESAINSCLFRRRFCLFLLLLARYRRLGTRAWLVRPLLISRSWLGTISKCHQTGHVGKMVGDDGHEYPMKCPVWDLHSLVEYHPWLRLRVLNTLNTVLCWQQLELLSTSWGNDQTEDDVCYNFTYIYSNTQRVVEVQLANSLLRGGCIQAPGPVSHYSY